MEYTLFQDFARKIPRPAPPIGRPDRAQSGRTPEFGYGPLVKTNYHSTFRVERGWLPNLGLEG